MKDVRGRICEIVSEMLDNPDEHGIYSTGKCYDKLEVLVQTSDSELRQAIGLAYTMPGNGDKVVDTVLADSIVKALKKIKEKGKEGEGK